MHIGTLVKDRFFCYLLVALRVFLGQVLILLQLKFGQFWFGIGSVTEEKAGMGKIFRYTQAMKERCAN